MPLVAQTGWITLDIQTMILVLQNAIYCWPPSETKVVFAGPKHSSVKKKSRTITHHIRDIRHHHFTYATKSTIAQFILSNRMKSILIKNSMHTSLVP